MKKKLMIDMDDVITDGTFRQQIEDFLGEKIDIQKTGYFLQEALGKRKEEFFRQKPLNMYESSPLKKDAYEVIQNLNEKFELYIVSSYNIPDANYQNGNHLKYKMEYLQEKLPFIAPEQIIFLNKKELIAYDIIIDDIPQNLKSGKLKLLFSTEMNQKIPKEELEKEKIIRVMNWKEIKQILLEEN